MRSSNPVFNSIERSQAYESVDAASYGGIISKTAILLLTAVLSGFLAINYLPPETLYGVLVGAFIFAFISVLIASFSVRLAPIFSVTYALFEGVLLGVITMVFEAYVPGVATAAVLATGAIFTVMLFLYSSRTIRVTHRFRRIMYGVLFGILLFVVLSLLLSLAGVEVAFTTPLVLLVSGVFIVFGALMLTLDFDRAEMIVEGGADKRYEWMVALGLMVTIVWIYLELLRFIAIIANSRR